MEHAMHPLLLPIFLFFNGILLFLLVDALLRFRLCPKLQT